MAVLTTGNTFSNGDQVTASSLNNAVNNAEFAAGAVDNTSTQLSGTNPQQIIVKDLGISRGKIAIDAVGTDQLANDVVINTSGSITGAAGSFTTLTASGDVTFDTDTLKVDSTNNRVGIGTASPSNKLSVSEASTDFAALITNSTSSGNGLKINAGDNSGDRVIELNDKDGNALMRVGATGLVGIGTASPTEKLQVVGDVRIGDGGGVDDDLILKGSDGIGPSSVGGSTSAAIITTNGIPTAAGHVGIEVPSNDNDDGFYVATDPNQTGTADLLALKINALGKVGIGETNPSAPLTVTSTTGGVLLPRMSTSNRTSISSPANGEMVYDTDLNKFYGYANGA